MKKVLGLGNALVDILVKIADERLLDSLQLPKSCMTLVEESQINAILAKITHLEKQETCGGSAANTISGLAHLGIQTGYVGKIGHDAYGTFFNGEMKQHGVTTRMFYGRAQTGRALGFITPDSERTFATFLGSAVELEGSDLNAELFGGYDIFHIEGYMVQNHQLFETAVRLAKEAGLEVSLDLASHNVVRENIVFLQTMVARYVDIVFANEDESMAFSGEKSPSDALVTIAPQCRIAVVKLGKSGSLVKRQDERHEIGCIPARAIDTTGAGDLYAAGFLYGLIRDYSLAICGRIGALLSGKVVEVVGAKLDEQKWQEVEAALPALLS
ncbi:MAG: adenosine kinase [Acidobacteria bacterium]|nr:adenosine kinase [Acidobacteriota bacterium]MBU4306715.1 adenosine kinase [Acidobacteriota bacterium]MBU4405342.1 adenosine kinase [Acidobacteriota bacterium]MCG2810148.1 adenosine kinase [Candidatus Aminicenantes bacterium]